MSEIEQDNTDPFEDLTPAFHMANVYNEGGEEALRELLSQFSQPTPDFLGALVNEMGYSSNHDFERVKQAILPDIVKDFAAVSAELESIGLFGAAKIIREYIR